MSAKKGNVFERFLGLFAEIRQEEALTTLLLMLDLFLRLTAYLIIKTVREPLILTAGPK